MKMGYYKLIISLNQNNIAVIFDYLRFKKRHNNCKLCIHFKGFLKNYEL